MFAVCPNYVCEYQMQGLCAQPIHTDEFEVKVGVHQISVSSPLFFIIMLEALSQEYWTGTPWELLFADGLVSFVKLHIFQIKRSLTLDRKKAL